MFLLLLGCQPPEFTTSKLWSGFHYEWETLSHRISLHQAQLHEDGSITMGMIGGDWSTGELFSDLPSFHMYQQEISDPEISVLYGETTIALYADQPQEITIELEAGAIGIALQGFRIDTDVAQSEEYPPEYNPAHGYTASGYTISLEPDLDNRQANLLAQVNWGPQDREDMNAAMLLAKSEMTVYWSQIKGTNPPTSYHVELSEEHDYDPPYSEHNTISEDIAHAADSVIGLRSFTLSIPDQDGSDMGSYWRRMGVTILPNENGSKITVDASNSSIIEEIPVELLAEITIDVYPLTHPNSTNTLLSSSETHEIGSHTYPAPR